MDVHSYELLQQADEDAYHNISRLLSVEQKPFQRIVTKLMDPDAPINRPLRSVATPTPNANAAEGAAQGVTAAAQTNPEAEERERNLWRTNMLIEFSLFDSSITRMQFIHNQNANERERYQAKKDEIEKEAQAVRDNTNELRGQLTEAQNRLTLRKTYDKKAEEIFGNPALKPRDEQKTAIDKLNEEIAELEQESLEYEAAWRQRKEQFGKILHEGNQMLKMIKDDKGEADGKDDMDVGQDGDDAEGSITKGDASVIGTPRPDTGGLTPMHIHEAGSDLLHAGKLPHKDRLAPPLSRANSQPASPAKASDEGQYTLISGPQLNENESPRSDSEMEEGEEQDDEPAQNMDMS